MGSSEDRVCSWKKVVRRFLHLKHWNVPLACTRFRMCQSLSAASAASCLCLSRSAFLSLEAMSCDDILASFSGVMSPYKTRAFNSKFLTSAKLKLMTLSWLRYGFCALAASSRWLSSLRMSSSCLGLGAMALACSCCMALSSCCSRSISWHWKKRSYTHRSMDAATCAASSRVPLLTCSGQPSHNAFHNLARALSLSCCPHRSPGYSLKASPMPPLDAELGWLRCRSGCLGGTGTPLGRGWWLGDGEESDRPEGERAGPPPAAAATATALAAPLATALAPLLLPASATFFQATTSLALSRLTSGSWCCLSALTVLPIFVVRRVARVMLIFSS
mmetsp:Transcript_19812/g.48049  ORF Transcript_19812/g.48049 Transcript_19812/m.48049 type:complete len:332 (-) Transcript_19812:210-1205(-)